MKLHRVGMFPGAEKIRLIVATLALLLLVSEAAFCSWWDFGYLPVPARTQKVKEEVRLIGAEEYLFTYYASELGLAELKNFYRASLHASGWVAAEPGTEPEKPKQEILFFKKDYKEIMISFVPTVAWAADGKKTKFILCQKDAPGFQEGEKSVIPELLSKPKKEAMPVYPKAKLVSDIGRKGTARLTYCSTDKIEAIAQYYRNKLPSLGWSLIGEDPLQEISAGKVLMQRQSFMNAKGEKCDIVLTKIFLPQSLLDALKSIGVFTQGTGESSGYAGPNIDYVYIMVEYVNAERGIR